MMSQPICPVCDHEHFSKISVFNDFRIEFCKACGHGVTLPVLSPAQLDRLYDEHYFDDQYEICSPDKNELKKKVKQEDHRVKVLRRHSTGGKLLDVGCGLGYFLYACKKYYEPFGFDVSTSNRPFIEDHLGIKLFSEEQDVKQFSDEQGRFGAITFWHSLEHFIDPSATLCHFKSLLKVDGVIIIDVPVNDSIDAGMEGSNWIGWQPPFHQHHFTSKSLDHFIKKHALDIVFSHRYRSGYVYRTLKKKWYLRPFARSIAKLFPGGSMVVVCKQAG